MPFFRRREGTLVRRAPTLRRLMPFLMPSRNEAVVYFEQQIEVANAVAFLETLNAGRPPERRTTLFQLVLVAMARTLALRPLLNRFVVGHRLYDRHAIEMSFAVKKDFSDGTNMTSVKVTIDPMSSLDAALERIGSCVSEGRGKRRLRSEKEMDLLTLLPRFLVRFVLKMQRLLDYFNLLPHSLIEADPLYASVFLANLGSVGLESAYHHLFEYGTVPLFVTMGRVKKAVVPGDGNLPVVRDVVSLKYTLDERIADGLYSARSLELLKGFLENPSSLTEPLTTATGLVAGVTE